MSPSPPAEVVGKCCELPSELPANSFPEFWVHQKNLVAFLTWCISDGDKV